MKTENGSKVTLPSRRSIRLQNKGEDNRKVTKSDNAKDLPNFSTNLLDLNDDCLYAIFDLSRISLGDLCSLTRTCTRLKDIGTKIFEHKHNQSCDLRKIEEKISVAVATSVMQLFGSTMSKLCISLSESSHPIAIIDSITRYCKSLKSLTLESYEVPDNENAITGLGLLFVNLTTLHLINVNIQRGGSAITTVRGTPINFFNQCQLLRSLRVEKCKNLERIIFESFFPKLERFSYSSYINGSIEGFILRHNGLKTFSLLMSYSTNLISNLEALTIGCKDLVKLKFGVHTNALAPTTTWLTRCMARLKYLREIKLVSVNTASTVAKLAEVFPLTLETLELNFCTVDAALILAMVHLKNLRIFRLYMCRGSLDVSHLGLTRLTELSFDETPSFGLIRFAPQFNLIHTVSNLIRLRKLKVNIKEFQLTKSLYHQLIDVIERRTDAENRYLEMECANVAKDFVYSNCRTVKINVS
ncbi:hypothetical protein HA402_014712 [Bradysia odoriphaga]|nr:hypothetical protein HA402_014712 [Bradysia odoriphaga]